MRNHAIHRAQEANDHDAAPKRNNRTRRHDFSAEPERPLLAGAHPRFPLLRAPDQRDVAQRREDISQRARARGADELEHDAEIARDERHERGGAAERGGEDQVAPPGKALVGEIEIRHDFAAHEAFERERRDHVQAEAEASDADHKRVRCW